MPDAGEEQDMSAQIRATSRVIEPRIVMEGAGVRLRRSIATAQLDHIDPFLLFDHFGSDNPEDYLAGFPMHPHRGLETVTYVLRGAVTHRDSIGNEGTIGPGDVQWMTAGRGIMHEEMPETGEEGMEGFQLWVNLPADLKMTEPRYREIVEAEIPVVEPEPGITIRVIAGEAGGITGPVTDISAEPCYLDVSLAPGSSFTHPVTRGHNAFAYLFDGEARFGDDDGEPMRTAPRLVIFEDGDLVAVQAGLSPTRFLLASGSPLNEPIARYGPFVMNTREEIEATLKEIREGTFIR
jgi:redox-sensitive bicupin YhaK (pirin superfamily)